MNGKAQTPSPPVAYYDFFKGENGKSTVVYPGGPSMTRQEFAEECDINAIMRRYETTGVLPANVATPLYVDWSSIPDDLMGALEASREAEAAFMTLPAVVRKQFENNAVAFADFASDPANLDQVRAWGLAPPADPPPAAAPGPPAAAPPGSPPAGPTQSSS